MKEKINIYMLEDEYGIESVLAQTVEEAIVIFRKYRKVKNGQDKTNITQIMAQRMDLIVADE